MYSPFSADLCESRNQTGLEPAGRINLQFEIPFQTILAAFAVASNDLLEARRH